MSRNKRTRRCLLLLGSGCVLLLAPLSGSAREPAGSYANIEKRKEKIDQLQDLLRIRKAELQLEQLALERENIRRKAREPESDKKPAETRDSTSLRPSPPPPPPRPAVRLASHGRLVEIFDDLVVIKIGQRVHELRRGNTLQGWRLREIGPDFVRLRRGGQNLQLDLALPSYARPLSATP